MLGSDVNRLRFEAIETSLSRAAFVPALPRL